MIDSKDIQGVYDELDKYLPGNWNKLVVYMEYGKTSYSFSFYIKVSGEYVKCYDLPDVTDDELADSFYRIDKLVSEARAGEKEPWSNMTVIIDNDGNVRADLDYTDLTDGAYEYKQAWKQKYLI